MAQEKYLGENGLKRLVGLVKEDLGTKANIDGSYDGMQVGSAKQIVSPTGITDTTPYVFRTTCGETSISGGDEQLASLKAIRGNTIVWNQLISISSKANTTLNGITFTNNHDGSYTLNGTATAQAVFIINQKGTFTNGHKYLVKGCPSSGSTSTYNLYIDFFQNDTGNGFIKTLNANLTGLNIKLVVESGTTVNNLVFRPQMFDLTAMFGAGNEPTSVLEFTRLFPKTYYPFNPGEIRNAKTTGLKTIGYNAFDGELRKGYYANGNYISLNNSVCNVNPIKVVPCQTYTLERSITFIPSVDEMAIAEYDENMNFIKKTGVNTATNKLTLTSNTHYCNWWIYKSGIGATVPTQEQAQISFHLTHSGSRTGFEPYEEHILHIDTAKYFPEGMNGVGTAYDELTPKVAIKRFAKVDLGTLNWVKQDDGTAYCRLACDFTKIKSFSVDEIANIVSVKYVADSASNTYNHRKDKTISAAGTQIHIYDSYFIDENNNIDFEGWKASLSGVYLIYELAEPVVTEIPQVRDNHWEIKVDDYGTEEWLFDEGNEIPVPVGHETLYMDNLVDKLRNLPDPNDYKALESEVQTWVKLPPLPIDTTKVYVPKFVNGTIKWVEE